MLVLFDIDGTLIDTGGAGLKALTSGFREAYSEEIGKEEFPEIDLRGATDTGIVRQLITYFELDPRFHHENIFYVRYLQELHKNLHTTTRAHLLAGAADLLEALVATKQHDLGLLTGNIEQAAWMKLERFEIADPFRFGAFGNEHEDRDHLAHLALKAAKETLKREVHGSQTVVIGDTPKDISAGKAIGARTIAVATGGYDSEALSEHQPDHLFDDLSDTEALVEAFAD